MATARATSAIAMVCRIWSAALRSRAKRSLKTAISWKPNSAWMPGSTMRHSSASICAASESLSSCRSSRRAVRAMGWSVGDAGGTRDGRGTRALPQRVVRGEQLRRLVAPLELVLHARAAERAHLRTPLRIVHQLDDLRGQVVRVVALRVERRGLRREAALGEVEL